MVAPDGAIFGFALTIIDRSWGKDIAFFLQRERRLLAHLRIQLLQPWGPVTGEHLSPGYCGRRPADATA